MGQAKRRGSKENRIAQALARRPTIQLSDLTPERIREILNRADTLFNGLTTPENIDEHVIFFSNTLSDKEPIYLNCDPESWSRQSCCDLNVREYIRLHGGEMLCGYRLWYTNPVYIEGERHAVWTDGTRIRDVSFVDTGENRTLFVPDISSFSARPKKIRHSFTNESNQILEDYEALERLGPPTITMSNEEAWERMPTYQQWLLEGARMPNVFLGPRPR